MARATVGCFVGERYIGKADVEADNEIVETTRGGILGEPADHWRNYTPTGRQFWRARIDCSTDDLALISQQRPAITLRHGAVSVCPENYAIAEISLAPEASVSVEFVIQK